MFDLLPEVVADVPPLKRGGMSVSYLLYMAASSMKDKIHFQRRQDCLYIYSSMSPFITFGNWEIRNDSGN